MIRIGANRFIRKIMSEVHEADPYLAIRAVVGRYRQPDEALEDVARNLGVQTITVEPLRFDGGVFEDASGLRVKLNSASPLKRRRFTLAHEIAHLILASGGPREAHRSHASTVLERACDAVAAEVLMPFDRVRAVVPRKASVKTLLDLGNQFGVSLQAVAVRVHELGFWTESVGFWRWDGNARELWFVGRRMWPDKRLYLSAFARAMKEEGTITTSEVIEEQGRGALPVSLEVRRLGTEFLIAVLDDRSRSRLIKRRGRVVEAPHL